MVILAINPATVTENKAECTQIFVIMSRPASPTAPPVSGASSSTARVSTSIPSVPIYKTSFDWNSPHPYEQFKLFKHKVDYLLVHGPCKDLNPSMKVSIFLNWLGDHSYELINTLTFPPDKSKEVLKDVIKQFNLYFKPSQNMFQSWYELRSFYSSQFKNQNDFLNKLINVSKDCNLDNPDELMKFLLLVHNQNARVHEHLLKDMKSESTLQDCLQIAKLTEGTVHVEKLGQNFLDNVDQHSQNVDAVNRGQCRSQGPHGFKGKSQSHSHSRGCNGSKGGDKGKSHVRIVEPITHLEDVLPLGRSVTIMVKTTTTKPFADPTVDEMEGEDLTMKLNKMMKAKMTGHFH